MKNCLLVILLVYVAGANAQPVQPIKIMLIGDSITAGKGYCWRYHLWKKFETEGYGSIDFVGDNKAQPYLGDFDQDNEGYGGKTTDEVAKLCAAGIARHQPDIAVIHLGTNDVTIQKQPIGETLPELAVIVDNLRAANSRVTIYLAKIAFVKQPDQGDVVSKLALEKTTADSRVEVIDLASDWKFEPGNDTTDYVHPNLNGVLKIADRVFTALVPELQRRGLKASPPPIKIKEEPPNLALGKPASADVAKPGFKAAKAVDGDLKTLWAAPDTITPHWLQIDLETPQNLTGSGIIWDSAGAAYGYKIEVCSESTPWITVVDKSAKPAEISVALLPQSDIFSATAVRFIRLTVTSIPNAPWTKYPAAIREFQIY